MYRMQVELRESEQRAYDLFLQNLVKGTSHLSLGQEAVATGFAAAMEPGDLTFCTYRGHAHTLARGVPMERVLGELMGRDNGLLRGKGGSMHLTSVEHGVMGSYAIVGAHIPIACGAAWRAQYRGDKDISVCFFGDGTTNIGAFHEGLNFAAIWKLPVVFVCENNLYMEYTPIGDVTAVKDPAAGRASAYGLESIIIDGQDADVVYKTAKTAYDKARSGGGPSLIECLTYRYSGHSRADPAKYRPEGELDFWRGKRDPISIYRERLLQAGIAESTLLEIEDVVKQRVEEATAICKAKSPPPPAELLTTDVYADGGWGMKRNWTYRDAVACAASRRRWNAIPTSSSWVEDIGKAGGVFKSYCRASSIGSDPLRVRDTPISEQAILGRRHERAAMTGLKPIAEIMFSDFIAGPVSTISPTSIRRAATMTNGQVKCPLVVRTATWRRQAAFRGRAAQPERGELVHDDPGVEGGLRLRRRSMSVGLLAASVRDPDPVIFLEHKSLYATKGEVPDGEILDQLGTAKIQRAGTDATILALALMVPRAMAAAEKLKAEHGVNCEVIDVRSLVPMDTQTMLGSVARTHRVFTVEENPRLCGWGAELVSIIADEAFYDLDGPPVRITTPHIPLPSTDILEDLAMPSVDRIVETIRGSLGT